MLLEINKDETDHVALISSPDLPADRPGRGLCRNGAGVD